MDADQKLTKIQTVRAIGQAIRYAVGASPHFLGFIAVEETLNRLVPFVNAWLLARLISLLPHVLHDGAIQAEAYRYIVLLAVVSIFPSVVSSFSNVYKSRQLIALDLKVDRQLQAAFANLPYAMYEDKQVLDAYDRASRFARNLGNFVLNRLTDVFGSIVTFVIATLAFWHFSPLLTLAILVLSLPTFWLELRLQRLREKLWRDNTLNYRKASVHADLLNPRIIKESRLLGLVDFAIEKSQHYRRSAELSNVQADQKVETYRLATLVLDACIEAMVLIRAVQRIAHGQLPVGQFIFVQQVASQFLGSLSRMSSLVQDMDEVLFGVSEFTFITEFPASPTAQKAQEPTADIRLENISFQYPHSEAWAIRDISLDLPAGQTVAIVGENGAGKSTLIKLLMKLYEPTEGTITVGTQALRDIDASSWHQHIGVLFQDFQTFYDFTLHDNVWFGNIARPQDDPGVTKALKAADAESFVRDLPKGEATFLGKYMDEENGTDLSGGQAQRLAVARTLFRNADVLILDEPTSAVDAKAEYKIFTEIEKARHGRTTIIISHRFSTVRKASYIYVMEKGRLKEKGTHEELMKHRSLYYEMFTKQAEGYR